MGIYPDDLHVGGIIREQALSARLGGDARLKASVSGRIVLNDYIITLLDDGTVKRILAERSGEEPQVIELHDGEKGAGITGMQMNPDYTLTIYYGDGSSFTTPEPIRGPQGDPGEPGEPGVSPSASVRRTEDGAMLTVNDASGTTTALIKDGAPGTPGSDASVTAENIKRALGYTPADPAELPTKDDVDKKADKSDIPDTSVLMPREQLMDAGIKSISWTTNVDDTFTTVEDPLKEQRPEGTATRYWVEMPSCPYFYHSKMYRVTFNGTVYNNLECRYGILLDEDKGSVIGSDTTVGGAWQMIGNRALYDSRYIDTGEPFAILYVEHGGMHNGGAYYYSSTVGHGILLTKTAQTVDLKIETATIVKEDLPHCLDEDFGAGDKLLETTNSTYPRSSWGQGNIVGRASFAIGISNIANGYSAVSIGNDNAATADSAVSIGYNNAATALAAFAIGHDNIASGRASHAEGEKTEASGRGAHAEGLFFGYAEDGVMTTASGAGSHAEGQATTASGDIAHSEGCLTIASGESSHAEGVFVGSNKAPIKTIASGYGAHAEGGGVNASGTLSHAENRQTEAAAMGSHAEGYGTYAGSNYQHTQGKFNIKDTASKYAHIVGNGTSDTARSNAHTLDWSGNAWYQGKVESASGVLKLGSTEMTEEQLKGLKKLDSEVVKTVNGVAPVNGNVDVEGGGAVNDVQVNGESILVDGVADIPYGAQNVYGLVRLAVGGDLAYRDKATFANLVLQLGDVNEIVKHALTDNKHLTMTAEQQATAQEVLGILSVEGVRY